ncbi:unnamed protein product [Adineta steineri]|uniref:ADP ribosyltransferase domain-containing protein n=1 Tax=Adineta steineri TaxID=433720 RepID=A0A813U6G3_9BILA|nr:unnamed protein product [Adineta steineri]CAF3576569.1 unnamed protein product [Adineta steineri]
MNADIIVRMGFFIKDLHRDIERVHSKQFNDDQSGKVFTFYRGQDLSKEDFTKMKNNKDGLLSFNNFLSTSKNPGVSLDFAQQAAPNADLVRILFVISINPANSTTPFASVANISDIPGEDEVLFSMHTIFRIGDIKPINESNHLYEANLTLTSDNDQDLRILTDHIRQETFPDSEEWYRLGQLLIKMGQFNKAQEVYEVLLNQTTDESQKAPIYHQLGSIKNDQGEYQEALTYYEKSLAIDQKTLPSNHLNFTKSYNNIGVVYDSMGDYPKALFHYEKALAIRQQSLPSNHPDLAKSYNNIGTVYGSMGDYRKALPYFEKGLAIQQQSLPSNHPGLGYFYNNIGMVYDSMGDYPKALSYYEKALAIRQQSLPSNHLDLGTSYNNIGLVYENMRNYSKAHSFYEYAVQIAQQSLPTSHPDLELYRENLEDMKKKL